MRATAPTVSSLLLEEAEAVEEEAAPRMREGAHLHLAQESCHSSLAGHMVPLPEAQQCKAVPFWPFLVFKWDGDCISRGQFVPWGFGIHQVGAPSQFHIKPADGHGLLLPPNFMGCTLLLATGRRKTLMGCTFLLATGRRKPLSPSSVHQ